MELTNKERLCFGLNEVKEDWIKKEINSNYIIYIDKNTLVKRIRTTENSYYENDLVYKLNEDNTLILPKTSKGNAKKNHRIYC